MNIKNKKYVFTSTILVGGLLSSQVLTSNATTVRNTGNTTTVQAAQNSSAASLLKRVLTLQDASYDLKERARIVYGPTPMVIKYPVSIKKSDKDSIIDKDGITKPDKEEKSVSLKTTKELNNDNIKENPIQTPILHFKNVNN